MARGTASKCSIPWKARIEGCTPALQEPSLWRGIAAPPYGIQGRRAVQEPSPWRGIVVTRFRGLHVFVFFFFASLLPPMRTSTCLVLGLRGIPVINMCGGWPRVCFGTCTARLFSTRSGSPPRIFSSHSTSRCTIDWAILIRCNSRQSSDADGRGWL